MRPPAWSSRPASGLNFTSTKPSVICADCSTHHGKVPLPDCFKTFGLLGADASASTFQTGKPLPVTPHVQSAGSVPGATVSNFSSPASAAVDVSIAIDKASGEILRSFPSMAQSPRTARDAQNLDGSRLTGSLLRPRRREVRLSQRAGQVGAGRRNGPEPA